VARPVRPAEVGATAPPRWGAARHGARLDVHRPGSPGASHRSASLSCDGRRAEGPAANPVSRPTSARSTPAALVARRARPRARVAAGAGAAPRPQRGDGRRRSPGAWWPRRADRGRHARPARRPQGRGARRRAHRGRGLRRRRPPRRRPLARVGLRGQRPRPGRVRDAGRRRGARGERLAEVVADGGAGTRPLEVVVAVPATVHADGAVRYWGRRACCTTCGSPTARRPWLERTPGAGRERRQPGRHRRASRRRRPAWSRFVFMGVRTTGIGMGLVIDGASLPEGANGRAGEIGNLRLSGDGTPLDARFTRISPQALTELAKVLAVTFAVLDLDGVVVHSETDARLRLVLRPRRAARGRSCRFPSSSFRASSKTTPSWSGRAGGARRAVAAADASPPPPDARAGRRPVTRPEWMRGRLTPGAPGLSCQLLRTFRNPRRMRRARLEGGARRR
jgi:hypothetical protein